MLLAMAAAPQVADLVLATTDLAVSVNPKVGSGPGKQTVQQLINWVAFMALALCALGLIVSGAMWGIGSWADHGRAASSGKSGVVFSGFAAALIGASAAIINWAEQIGGMA